MKRLVSAIAISLSVFFATLSFSSPVFATTGCGTSKSFFGLKPWYSALETETFEGRCEISASNFSEDQLFTTVWAIILTILSDLFFLAGFGAVIMVIYSGARYILSAGNIAAATQARNTLVGSITGLLIVLVANVIVNLILGLF